KARASRAKELHVAREIVDTRYTGHPRLENGTKIGSYGALKRNFDDHTVGDVYCGREEHRWNSYVLDHMRKEGQVVTAAHESAFECLRAVAISQSTYMDFIDHE